MLERMERRNRQVWEGHPRSFEDFTHVLGGVGLGLLLYGLVRPSARRLGWLMVGLSAALHVYAATHKPSVAQQAEHGFWRMTHQ